MKKIAAILFAVLILVSGMHPAISTHFCGGSVAAVKWSFTGENASCGMPTDNQEIPLEVTIKNACCQNVTAVYSVDDNYSPTSFHFNLTPELSLFVFALASDLLFNEFTNLSLNRDTKNSPGNLIAGSVSLSDLCTFRI